MNKLLRSGYKGFRVVLVIVGGVVGIAASQAFGSSVQTTNLVSQARAVTADTNLASPSAVRVAGYDASVTYKGSHETQGVYKLVQGPQVWRPNRRPALLREVACRDARRALEQRGVWTGRLGTDGSCRSGDETEWATGNYLNFQAGPHETDADL